MVGSFLDKSAEASEYSALQYSILKRFVMYASSSHMTPLI